jgi:hypothetical protein
MRKFTAVQQQLNAFRTQVIDTTTIGEFDTEAQAVDFLLKRNYRFDNVAQAYINGNTVQYPVVIQPPRVTSLFDIRSFV